MLFRVPLSPSHVSSCPAVPLGVRDLLTPERGEGIVAFGGGCIGNFGGAFFVTGGFTVCFLPRSALSAGEVALAGGGASHPAGGALKFGLRFGTGSGVAAGGVVAGGGGEGCAHLFAIGCGSGGGTRSLVGGAGLGRMEYFWSRCLAISCSNCVASFSSSVP